MNPLYFARILFICIFSLCFLALIWFFKKSNEQRSNNREI